MHIRGLVGEDPCASCWLPCSQVQIGIVVLGRDTTRADVHATILTIISAHASACLYGTKIGDKNPGLGPTCNALKLHDRSSQSFPKTLLLGRVCSSVCSLIATPLA